MTIEFDAIGYAQQLESAGVPRNQADVHAKALTEVVNEVASGSDLSRLENTLHHDLHHGEQRLTSRIDLVKTELSAKIETNGGKCNTKIDLLNGRVDEFRTEFKAEIKGVKTGLEAKIDGFKAELDAKIDGCKTELKAEIKGIKTGLEAKVDGFRTELKAELKEVKSGLDAKTDGLASDIRSIKTQLAFYRWLFGLLIAMVTPIFVKTFFP